VSRGSAPAKPAHLGSVYGAQFDDEAVARSYATRPPYPAEVFEILDGLQPAGPRSVLDLGCGTGDVALGLVGRAGQIVGVDRSAAMLRVARGRHGGGHPSLAWHQVAAEDFAFDGPYSLVVAGESLHWMDWDTVLPSFAAALELDGFLALISRKEHEVPWGDSLKPVYSRYSTNQDYRPYDMIHHLESRGLFRTVGKWESELVPFVQPIEEYIEGLHSMSSFSRERMDPAAIGAFDDEVRAILLAHADENSILHMEIVGSVEWGTPLSGP